MEDFLNVQQQAINKLVSDVEQSKLDLLKKRLEKMGIEIDLEAEQNARFKKLVMITEGEEQHIYYNDGTPESQRVISFKYVVSGPDLSDIRDPKLTITASYQYY